MQWIIRTWIPIAIASTLMCGLIYATAQQQYRQSLNDPQIQIAEDAAAIMTNGGVPADVVPRIRLIDASASLAPWIAVYDASGTPLEADATIAGKPPAPPIGVLMVAKAGSPLVVGHHLTGSIPQYENRVTWQTLNGTRIALVVRYIPEKQMYIVSGRNMSVVEDRIWQLSTTIGIAWIVTLLLTLLAVWFGARWTTQPGESW